MRTNAQMFVIILLLDANDKTGSDDGINSYLWLFFPFLRKKLVVRFI